MTEAKTKEKTEQAGMFIYWLPADEIEAAKARLDGDGFHLSQVALTPCQVLKAEADKVVHAPPEIWSGFCSRQGSWYRSSHRNGQHLLAAARRLPAWLDAYLDVEMVETDFRPEQLPTEDELEALVDAREYRDRRPDDWEKVSRWDPLLLKIFFTVNGFWRRGDHMKRHWVGHRANHANFLAKRFVGEVDGEEVAYSVTNNSGVCSSCAEFFNVVSPDDRKLVRACPGSVSFGGAKRDVYYDVRPVGPAGRGKNESGSTGEAGG